MKHSPSSQVANIQYPIQKSVERWCVDYQTEQQLRTILRVSCLLCTHRQGAEPSWVSQHDGADWAGLQAKSWVPDLALPSPTSVLLTFLPLISFHEIIYRNVNNYLYWITRIWLNCIIQKRISGCRQLPRTPEGVFGRKHLLSVNRIPNECLILSLQAYNLFSFPSPSMALMTQQSMFFSTTLWFWFLKVSGHPSLHKLYWSNPSGFPPKMPSAIFTITLPSFCSLNVPDIPLPIYCHTE